MRLIDADRADIFSIPTHYRTDTTLWDVKKWLEDQLTIEAEPVKHGRWEEYPSPLFLRCSVCKCEYEKSRMPLKHVGWCPNPNCGAKMDLKEEK